MVVMTMREWEQSDHYAEIGRRLRARQKAAASSDNPVTRLAARVATAELDIESAVDALRAADYRGDAEAALLAAVRVVLGG